MLAAFQSVADTLVSLQQDADAVAQTQRAQAAARAIGADTQAKFKLGSAPYYATLTARQQYQDASVQYLRARAARLADTAALFDSMGEPPRGSLEMERRPSPPGPADPLPPGE